MAEMGEMEMPMPDNTLPMMTGFGQFGPIEMGGMFSVVKVREGLARDDYNDPGRFQHPAGTVAYEVERTRGRARASFRQFVQQPSGRRGQGGQAGHQDVDQATASALSRKEKRTMRTIGPSVAAFAICARHRRSRLRNRALIDGEVTKVDQSASKITLKHGPIKKLGWTRA